MNTYTEKTFLELMDNRAVGVDNRYPTMAILKFIPENPECSRFWEIPSEPERRPYFIASVLEAMSPWTSCFAWRHMGSWPTNPDPLRLNDRIEFGILKSIGLPMGTADIIEFGFSEIDLLITLIFSTSIFGWSINEDLYVVPDTAKYIIKVSHHEAIHVSFRNSSDMESFIRFMAERGFPLPDEVPDDTFKQPEWMKERI
jgi:hypothetical protein